MTTIAKTKSAAVRRRLKHPIVDGDGHFLEVMPVLRDYFRDIGGLKLLERYLATLPAGQQNFDGGPIRVGGPAGWEGLTPAERHDRRVSRNIFWWVPTKNALDRATVTLPKLFRERLDDLGIDFAILYGSSALGFLRNPDDEIRRVGCRAFNTMSAEMYRPHAARMTVAATIPMHTPDEAIDELEYAVKKLGMKAVVLATCIRRPIREVARRAPELASYATWMDVLALSSDYDYDPVWQKCIDLGVAVTTHTNLVGWGARTSPDSFVYNHIGHFGSAGEAFCKALVMGGVVQRFPTLKFSFLEGGVGWACSLYNDLIEHWEKRNVEAMRENLDPANLDRTEIAKLFARYGEKLAEQGLAAISDYADSREPEALDEWAALEIDHPRRFAEFFSNFFFGCEADDRMTAIAFNPKLNHYGAKMQAIFSSDVGHFDVPDITAVVAEAYELVEEGLLSEGDFRDFTFANSVRLHASMNPDFFKGTSVEEAATAVMASSAEASR